MDPLAKRREQNLRAARPDARVVTPSTRDFTLALQRGTFEHVPWLKAADSSLAAGLDQAEALAIAIEVDDPPSELQLFSRAARAISIPVLRTDLLLEEFQIYESRVAGADAVVLRASVLPPELLARMTQAARGTHMAPVIACSSAAELQLAIQLQPQALLLAAQLLDGPRPPRMLILSEAPDRRADASLNASIDSAEAFRKLLEE